MIENMMHLMNNQKEIGCESYNRSLHSQNRIIEVLPFGPSL
jgi:hypothetical protein